MNGFLKLKHLVIVFVLISFLFALIYYVVNNKNVIFKKPNQGKSNIEYLETPNGGTGHINPKTATGSGDVRK